MPHHPARGGRQPLYRPMGFIQQNPALLIAASFAVVILTGAILLTLPISSREREFTPFLNALFVATSATCVTGLTVYDTYLHFSLFGQTVIISLIQVGGLGLVTMTSFFYSVTRRKVGLRNAQLAQESISADSRSNTMQLLSMVMKVTFGTELIGAILFMPVLIPDFGWYGLYMSFFYAISAYCNAGFDLFGMLQKDGSLMPYQHNAYFLTIIMALIVCGGLGFIVWQDLLTWKRKKIFHFHTKVALVTTACLLVGGCVLFLLIEWSNPATIGTMGFFDKTVNAMFQSVTCRTAGFASFDQASMHDTSKILSTLLMYIGAGPGSTGGGIKNTTALIIFMTVISVIRGDEETMIMGRRVSHSTVYRSLAVAVLSGILLITIAAILFKTGAAQTMVDALYESASAFGTVGLTCGVTANSGPAALIAMIIEMYLGRVGPVGFALSLVMRKRTPASRMRLDPEAKIWVA